MSTLSSPFDARTTHHGVHGLQPAVRSGPIGVGHRPPEPGRGPVSHRRRRDSATLMPVESVVSPVEREQQLSAVLSDFARTMLTDFHVQGILDELVGRIVEMLPITGAGVTLISKLAGPRYVAASDPAALRFEELQTELGEGPCLAAYLTGEAISVPDLSDETRFKLFSVRALDAGLSAAFTFPLRQGSRRLGALDLYRDSPGALSPEDLVTAQTLADVAAAYLANAQARADLQDASSRSQELAMLDALTGLPNRPRLLERLEHAVLRSGRSSKMLALLFIDLDRFKDINDTYGHAMGDALLIAVGLRIMSDLRPGDTLARLAGDEFVVLCEELDDESQATLIAQRVVAALGMPFRLEKQELTVSASVGIAFAGPAGQVPDQLLHDADVAMYQVKRRGGSSHQIIDLRQQRLSEQRSSLERDLRGAIARGELRTHYQPIVRSADGVVRAAETLLRWEHPTEGAVPPTTAIAIAEQTGQINQIGRWVLEQGCRDSSDWRSPVDGAPVGIAVNVSAHQLMTAGFVDLVSEVLAATHTPAERLTLEITETVFVKDPDRALVVLNGLKLLGVTLALDDFGTGYSSLSYLKRFPVDIVKIDQMFIADMQRDASSAAIVEAIVDLSHRLAITVTAEGVETVEQRDEIVRLGGETAQGYYFGRPQSAASFTAALAGPAPV
jgi:diguanylate cyclase (GGDEF)-like protein